MNYDKYLKMAAEVALESGCIRGKRGTVLVKDDKVLVKTYNMVYPVNDFCQKNGCLRDKLGLGLGKEAEKCRSIHSEARAITIAAKEGLNISGAQAFITCAPCMNCAKLLVSAGIKQIFYLDEHGDKTSLQFLDKMGVNCSRVVIEGDDNSQRLRDTNGQ